MSYFELSILKTPHDTEPEAIKDQSIVIGLSGEFVNQLNAVPGWNMWSLGYHGHDGNVFEDSLVTGHIKAFAKLHDVYPTVGCGVDYQRGDYFFTCDGEVVCKLHLVSYKV